MASEHVAILTGPLRTNLMIAIVDGVLGDVRCEDECERVGGCSFYVGDMMLMPSSDSMRKDPSALLEEVCNGQRSSVGRAA